MLFCYVCFVMNSGLIKIPGLPLRRFMWCASDVCSLLVSLLLSSDFVIAWRRTPASTSKDSRRTRQRNLGLAGCLTVRLSQHARLILNYCSALTSNQISVLLSDKEMIGNAMHQADVGVALGLAFFYKAGLLPMPDVGRWRLCLDVTYIDWRFLASVVRRWREHCLLQC